MFHDKSPLARIEWLLETNGHAQIPLGVAAAIGGGAALSGITSLIGGGKQAGAANRAAQIQAQAALQAANLQESRFQQAAGNLQPFIGMGEQAIFPLQALTGVGTGGTGVLNAPLTSLPATWSPTTAQLANMPGYQFALGQGLLSTQASLAGTGLGRSGAAVKAADQFATGLAQTDWQSNWNQFLQQQQLLQQGKGQTYNMLTGQIGTGLSASGATAGVALQSGANIGNTLQAAGAASASGVVGASNAWFGPQGGVTGASQGIGQSLLLSGLLANQAATAGGGGGAGTGLIPGTDIPLSGLPVDVQTNPLTPSS